jgi:hypothetical protein
VAPQVHGLDSLLKLDKDLEGPALRLPLEDSSYKDSTLLQERKRFCDKQLENATMRILVRLDKSIRQFSNFRQAMRVQRNHI